MSEIQVGQINSTDGSTAITTGAGGTVTLSAALTGTDATLSGGVYLGGTGAANYLDDYEEGTWTPTIAGSSTAGTATYVLREGTYTKTGRTVVARTFMIWNSGTGSGTLRVTNLPFSNSSSNVYGAVSIANTNNLSLSSGYALEGGYVNDGDTQVVIIEKLVGGSSISAVNYDSAAEIMVTAVYETA